MLEFVWPWAFLLIIGLPFIRFLLPSTKLNQPALPVPETDDYRFNESVGKKIRSTRAWVKLIALLLAWSCLVTALSRPMIIGEPVSLPTTGRDILLAVDISQSMQIDDMYVERRRVTRLEALKYVVSSFIDSRYGDRIGLILFGSQPHTYVPLTFDIDTVNTMLQEAPVGIAGGQTAIGDTIGLAVKRLMDRPTEQRILILMTDGSHNSGNMTPEEALRLADEAQVRIHTIGLGTESPSGNAGFNRFFNWRNRAGKMTLMDVETLQNISDTTGGRFFSANNTETLQEIYEEITKLEPQVQDPETLRPTKSLFHWPLLAAMGLFGTLWWLRT